MWGCQAILGQGYQSSKEPDLQRSGFFSVFPPPPHQFIEIIIDTQHSKFKVEDAMTDTQLCCETITFM